eukprot:5674866-Pyramimonas_sp.AAC.1
MADGILFDCELPEPVRAQVRRDLRGARPTAAAGESVLTAIVWRRPSQGQKSRGPSERWSPSGL